MRWKRTTPDEVITWPQNTLLGNFLSSVVKSLESRDACGSWFIPIEPSHRTHHINPSGNPKVLQVRFGQANIPGAAHAKGTHSLGKRGFDAFPQGILFGKGSCLLPTTGGLKRFMLGLWSYRDGSPFVLLF
jgi:hypothetical protein